ncbi:MAG: 2-C-methyl-D-erythritol 2,4-cyclodiphosphate synthase [Bacillota bacterium]
MRVGIGYDVHQLVENETLIIGGVKITSEYGLKGHSDADVLTHALMDALLGAAGKGDIGRHFPDTDVKYKGISSLVLLSKVKELLTKEGFNIVNIDMIIMAEEPKMSPFYKDITNNYSNILDISRENINIKATTTEKLGFIGKKEGIAAQSVVLIQKGGKINDS